MPLLMCPNCNLSMQSINRSGVEFDMCPNCRGVWLDRGELEKVIAEVQAALPAAPLGPPSQPGAGTGPGLNQSGYPPVYGHEPAYDPRYRRYDDDDDDRYDDDRRRRRRGFSLFDIFD